MDEKGMKIGDRVYYPNWTSGIVVAIYPLEITVRFADNTQETFPKSEWKLWEANDHASHKK